MVSPSVDELFALRIAALERRLVDIEALIELWRRSADLVTETDQPALSVRQTLQMCADHLEEIVSSQEAGK